MSNISSPATALPLAGYTDKIVYMADHELAVVTADMLRVIHRDQGHISHNVQLLEIDASDLTRGGFDHYMLKEIFEQPESVRNVLRGRLDYDAADVSIRRFEFNAAAIAFDQPDFAYRLRDKLARGDGGRISGRGSCPICPSKSNMRANYDTRNPPMDNNTLVFAITQSGETLDTLAAVRELKRKGCPTLGICNVVGSSIAQETDGGAYLRAGPEIGVASTKAFTSQCTILAMLALHFGRLRHLSYSAGVRIIEQLEDLAQQGPSGPRLQRHG